MAFTPNRIPIWSKHVSPSNVYRRSIKGPSKVHRKSIEGPSKVHRRSIEDPSKVVWMSIKGPLKVFNISVFNCAFFNIQFESHEFYWSDSCLQFALHRLKTGQLIVAFSQRVQVLKLSLDRKIVESHVLYVCGYFFFLQKQRRAAVTNWNIRWTKGFLHFYHCWHL